MTKDPSYLVIPAAGLGTRMMHVNPDIPKEMLIVKDRPAIQSTVEEGMSSGIKNIIIIINRQKEIIRRYFEDKKFREKMYPLAANGMDEIDRENTITFLYQEELLGEADAISLARDTVGEDSLAIMYPDNIYVPAPGALKLLKSVYKKHGQDVIGLMEVTEENAGGISNTGRVNLTHLGGDIYRIEKIHPKEDGHFIPGFKGELRTCGIAISGSHIFEYIETARDSVREGEFTDVTVRTLMLDRGEKFLGCRLPGIVFDIGNPKGYELCLKYITVGD